VISRAGIHDGSDSFNALRDAGCNMLGTVNNTANSVTIIIEANFQVEKRSMDQIFTLKPSRFDVS
jgi:hypothetical protein